MTANRYSNMGSEYEFFPLILENPVPHGATAIFADALAALESATELRELAAAAQAAATCLGFDTFTYGCIMPRIKDCPMVFVFTTVAQAWMSEWHERGYSEKDPRLLHCYESVMPYAWSLEQFRSLPDLGNLTRDFERQGLCAGLVVPLNFHLARPVTCKGMFSLNSRDPLFWQARVNEKMRLSADASLMASRLQQRLLDLGIMWRKYVQHEQMLGALTEREREVLMTWSGEPYKEVARKLEISPATTRKHFASLMTKLNVKSKAQLLLIAREYAYSHTRPATT